MIRKLHRFFNRFAFYRAIGNFLKRVTLPGFEGLSIHTVFSFYAREADDEELQFKAAYLAFNMLLAIFPAVIFFFTLIAYLPIQNVHKDILSLISTLMPDSTYKTMDSTLKDILSTQRSGLLSFGFLAALYFSTNAVDALVKTFHKSSGVIDKRPLYKKKIYSVLLNCYLSLLFILSVFIITGGSALLKWLYKVKVLNHQFQVGLISGLNWLIVVGLIFIILSSLYTFGPLKRRKWGFVTPGSFIATALILVLSAAFSYYVNNFNSYNKIYGSIGTLIVIMLWLYLNCLITLIGYDLNVAIDRVLGRARQEKESGEALEKEVLRGINSLKGR